MNRKEKRNSTKKLEDILLDGLASWQAFQLPVNPWRPIEERETRQAECRDEAA